jgi:hypothetical protein
MCTAVGLYAKTISPFIFSKPPQYFRGTVAGGYIMLVSSRSVEMAVDTLVLL